MLTATPRQPIDGLPPTSNGGKIEARQEIKVNKTERSDKKTDPEELQPPRGLMLGIYHKEVSLAWLYPATLAG